MKKNYLVTILIFRGFEGQVIKIQTKKIIDGDRRRRCFEMEKEKCQNRIRGKKENQLRGV